jgi:hypothetical protein
VSYDWCADRFNKIFFALKTFLINHFFQLLGIRQTRFSKR